MNEDVRELFRQYAARRQRADKPCVVCGTIMPHALLKARYCSRRCEAKHYRQRVKERTSDGS